MDQAVVGSELERGIGVMINVPIRIRGVEVGHLYAHNTGKQEDDKFVYYYEYHFIGPNGRWSPVGGSKVISGYVRHNRDQGIALLLSEILLDVENKRVVE